MPWSDKATATGLIALAPLTTEMTTSSPADSTESSPPTPASAATMCGASPG
jgi:hypothetical protein